MPKNRLRDLQVDELSFVNRAAVRDADDNTQPMRFLLWKAESADAGDTHPDERREGVQKSALSTQARDALKDSDFADSANRRYPLTKTPDGPLDQSHVANARARCAQPQTACSPLVKAKIDAAAKKLGIGEFAKEEDATVDVQEALAVIARATGSIKKDEGQDDTGTEPDALAALLKSDDMPDDVRSWLQAKADLTLDDWDNEPKTDVLKDDSELVQILKEQGILPAVREMLQKSDARAHSAEAEAQRLKLEKAEDAVRTELAKAEEFVGGLPYLGISEDGRSQVAKALFVMRREDARAAGELERVLKANNTRMQTSALWSELGIAGQAGRGFGSAKAELHSRAVELRKEEGGKHTLDQVKARLLEEDADLSQRLDEEGIEAK